MVCAANVPLAYSGLLFFSIQIYHICIIIIITTTITAMSVLFLVSDDVDTSINFLLHLNQSWHQNVNQWCNLVVLKRSTWALEKILGRVYISILVSSYVNDPSITKVLFYVNVFGIKEYIRAAIFSDWWNGRKEQRGSHGLSCSRPSGATEERHWLVLCYFDNWEHQGGVLSNRQLIALSFVEFKASRCDRHHRYPKLLGSREHYYVTLRNSVNITISMGM